MAKVKLVAAGAVLVVVVAVVLALFYQQATPLSTELYLPPGLAEALKGAGKQFSISVEGLKEKGGRLPVHYSCDEAGAMPKISWSSVTGAASYAVVVYDPDAPIGMFYHLVAYNIHGTSLAPEDLGKVMVLPNTAGQRGWFPVCPPKGSKPHRYYFVVLALSEDLPANLRSVEDLFEALRGKVVAYGWTVGLYSR